MTVGHCEGSPWRQGATFGSLSDYPHFHHHDDDAHDYYDDDDDDVQIPTMER